MSKRTLSLFAIGAVWLASMLWFGSRQAGCQNNSRSAITPAAADREEWHGIYLQGQKIGYSVTFRRNLPVAAGGGQAVSNKMFMRLNLMQTVQEVLTTSNYTLDARYQLKDVDFKLSGAAQMEIRGKVNGTILNLAVISNGQATEQRIDLNGPVYLPDALDAMISGKTLKAGDRYDFSIFDPASMSVQPAIVRVAARETLAIDSVRVPALKLLVEFSGTATGAWVDSSGRTLREEGPMGIVMLAESRDKALLLPDTAAGIDLLTSLSVPNTGIEPGDPRATCSMKVRLSGLDWSGMDIDGGRQHIADPEGRVVVVSRDDTSGGTNRLTADQLRPYRMPTPLIQSNDPKIQALAGRLVKGMSNDRDKALAISRWVNSSLAKQMTVSLPSALEVLESKRGDCNEHATLFVALARAAGIPATLCLGVIYLNGRFYYHAWNSVYCGRWIELDPTFGQFPADAARLRLIEGDLTSQNRLLPAFGKLEIEILEAK